MTHHQLLLRQEQCPNCAKLGRDTSKDNLAVYSDGHSWCYSCGYYQKGSVVVAFKEKGRSQPTTIDKHKVVLPVDCSTDYPSRAVDWIQQYELTRNDMLRHHVLWSDSWQRLIFPYFGSDGLIAWQGRYFGKEEKGKWFNHGKLDELFHVLGSGEEIILVEDIVSAIKVSRFTSSMPIFGSFISYDRLRRLHRVPGSFKKVGIWLDPDKRAEALVANRRASLLGWPSRVIYSDKDPKEHTWQQLENYLQVNGM